MITISVQRGTRSEKADKTAVLRYFQSAYGPVRLFQVPCPERPICLPDSSTSSVECFGIGKADDRGVLDVHRGKTTQKIPKQSRTEACVPLSTYGKAVTYNTDSIDFLQMSC